MVKAMCSMDEAGRVQKELREGVLVDHSLNTPITLYRRLTFTSGFPNEC